MNQYEVFSADSVINSIDCNVAAFNDHFIFSVDAILKFSIDIQHAVAGKRNVVAAVNGCIGAVNQRVVRERIGE
ncbi:hypothetical protein DSECCO2_455200 [anaerobic digester metagenome]